MTKKMNTKRHSSLARAAMMLLFTVLTTVTTWAAEWPSYITNVVLVGGTESEAQSAKSGYSGYTWCSKSLNDGTSGDVIYIGYKTGNSANTNGGYITDFIVVDAVDHNPPSTISCNGHTYYLCPADGADYFANSNHGNLTSHASQGWNIYLYYTKEHFSDKRAVSSIAINDTKSGAIDCYKKDGTLLEENISLNRGVKNTPYVYMHIYTETKVNRPYPEPTTISGLTYDGSPHQLIPSNYDSDYSGDVYFRLGTTGSYTDVVNSITATNAGTYTIYYYSGESYYGNSSVDYAHTMTATIAKSPNSGLTVSCSNYLEGTAPVPSLVGNNLSTGTITYKYSTSQNGEYTTTKPTAPGTYWVKATIAGDGNCETYTTAPVSFTITYNWAVHNSGNTETDAYVIRNADDLGLLAQRVNGTNGYTADGFSGKYFKLGADITFDKNTANNFTSIGNENHSFAGIFDGQGNTISGIYINKSDISYNGLFGKISSNAEVKNLTLDNSQIVGRDYCGGIVGYSYKGTISNCHVTSSVTIHGTMTYSRYHGGIVGFNNNGTVTGCSSAVTVSYKSGTTNMTEYGGIAGRTSGDIQNCIVYGGSILGTANVGAVVGYRISGTLTNNYYTTTGCAGVGGADGAGARKALTISADKDVTITPRGTATTYNVSGITAYADNSGISYGGKLYAGATEAVNLTLTYSGTVPEYYILIYYSSSIGIIGGNATDGYTITMPNADVTISASFEADIATHWQAGADRDGRSEAKAYIITTTAGLNLLAKEVNRIDTYQGYYFELGADITYDYTGLGETESNFTTIGGENRYFSGIFDGKGHTISGIRIYNEDSYQGLFGRITNTAEVNNVILADATITGYNYTGGIVGRNDYGKVTDCHVLSSVAINKVKSDVYNHGGIAGENNGTITGCTSAAALNNATDNSYRIGGITGHNASTISQCVYLGTTIGGGSCVGAITGQNYATVETCYFTDTNIQGKDNLGNALDNAESAVGDNNSTAIVTNCGPAHKVTLGEGVSTTVEATNWENGFTYDGNNYYRVGLELPLAYSGSVPGGYIFDGFTATNGGTISGNATDGYTLTMPNADVTVSAAFAPDIANFWHADANHDGSTKDKAYIITTPAGLDLLAKEVNGGNDYDGKYFKLDADITYTHGDSDTENNYTAIGGYYNSNYRYFKGHFDGQGHTVSGIRIYKSGNSNADGYQGLFGEIFSPAEVKNVILADARITGYWRTGAIVGNILSGTVENCHVLDNVTVHAVQNNADWYGGIAGDNGGTITGCTSAAALTTTGSRTATIGGIAGGNGGIVEDCIYLGTTLGGYRCVGAIVGTNNGLGTVETCYFTDTQIQGKGNYGDALANAESVVGNNMGGTVTDCGLAHKVTLDEGITLGDYATEYGLLTVYGNVVAMTYYDGTSTTIYSLAGSEISLNNYTGTMPEGYTFEYTATNGAPISGNATDGYTLTMPNTDVTVSATFMPDFATYWHADADHDGSTEAKAYIITTTTGLNLLAKQVNSGQDYNGKYFELGADITYDGTENKYTPIGNNFYVFKGNFDGKGHTVSGININQPGTGLVGLFGNKSFGFVKNLTLANSTIIGKERVGGIAGLAINGVTIENCHIASDVTVNGEGDVVGGIAGLIQSSNAKGCTSAATVSGNGLVGGIAGYNYESTIQDCLYTGSSVSGNQQIGAIVGDNYSGTLTNNYHTVNGMGGVDGSDEDGARLAITTDTKPDTFGDATATYGTGTYTGITVYGTNGLAYDGKYYYANPWRGSGTEGDPYIITTTAGLDLLAAQVNSGQDYNGKYFELGADITYDGTENNYTPIGMGYYEFYGNFDGKGHTVSGININQPETGLVGLFGNKSFGFVKNLTLANSTIIGNERVGGIVGLANNGVTIENCHVASSVTVNGKEGNVGGIAGGIQSSSYAKGCTSAATVSAPTYIGGIAGYSYESTIQDCLYTGSSVSGKQPIGAIVGDNYSGTLTNNYHTVNGMGGVDGSDEDGARLAITTDTKPDTFGDATATYGTGTYTGITVYGTNGLAYGGKYYANPWRGSGTEGDPYIITTTTGLDLLAAQVNSGQDYNGKYFELGADITYDGTENNYTPIGNDYHGFYGNFDGKGHTVSGININQPETGVVGLFGRIEYNGFVKNLTLANSTIIGNERVGGIAGLAYNGVIENCHIASDVTVNAEDNGVGGIAGLIQSSNAKGCTSAATVSGNGYVGGIAGYNYESTIQDCLYTGSSVSGKQPIGAIVGYNYSGTLTNNYHTVDGMSGVYGSDQDGARFAKATDTKPDTFGDATATYGTGTYTGITVYANGLYYDGKYYYYDPYYGIWTGSGTKTDPYVITTPKGLDKLASDVNSGKDYEGTYFVLGADIAYDNSVMTVDVDGDGNLDSNYAPIGNKEVWIEPETQEEAGYDEYDSFFFRGSFDGQGHTISGIRTSTQYNYGNDYIYTGVFGLNGGLVKNLKVEDCYFATDQYVGGVVGYNTGTIENCHVADDVVIDGALYVGGIVGRDDGTIKGCTSAVPFYYGERIVNCYGGIVGESGGTLTDNLFTGTIYVHSESRNVGAITGLQYGTLANNYHTVDGMGGVGTANNAIGSDQNGARFAEVTDTKPDTFGDATTTYGTGTYTGITAYANGLAYNGLYYYHQAVLKGDANGDGQVTITDAVGIVNYILGNPSGGFNESAADVSGDGKITITDAVGVVNIILNNGASAPELEVESPATTQEPE